MPPTLPSPIAREMLNLLGFVVISACGPPQGPVPPGPPIPVDPPVTLRPMNEECDAMVTALTTYAACPNLDEDEHEDIKGWIDLANDSFTAGRKVELDDDAKKAIAGACRRATMSVKAAAERCSNGPRPKS